MLKRVALLIAATALAVPAQAQDVRVDPDHIITVLKDAGYPAEYYEGNDSDDYRQILSKSGDYQFLVEMYDCVDGKECQTLEFYSNFPVEQLPTKERLDAYSGPREDTNIFLDRRGVPIMRLELDLPSEGLSDAQFIDRLKYWETVMAGFVDFLAQDPAAAAPATTEAAAPAATEPAATS